MSEASTSGLAAPELPAVPELVPRAYDLPAACRLEVVAVRRLRTRLGFRTRHVVIQRAQQLDIGRLRLVLRRLALHIALEAALLIDLHHLCEVDVKDDARVCVVYLLLGPRRVDLRHTDDAHHARL